MTWKNFSLVYLPSISGNFLYQKLLVKSPCVGGHRLFHRLWRHCPPLNCIRKHAISFGCRVGTFEVNPSRKNKWLTTVVGEVYGKPPMGSAHCSNFSQVVVGSGNTTGSAPFPTEGRDAVTPQKITSGTQDSRDQLFFSNHVSNATGKYTIKPAQGLRCFNW